MIQLLYSVEKTLDHNWKHLRHTASVVDTFMNFVVSEVASGMEILEKPDCHPDRFLDLVKEYLLVRIRRMKDVNKDVSASFGSRSAFRQEKI